MKSSLHNSSNRKINSFSHKNRKKNNPVPDAKEAESVNKNFLKKLLHPDYILFDWKYFSRDLEFE